MRCQFLYTVLVFTFKVTGTVRSDNQEFNLVSTTQTPTKCIANDDKSRFEAMEYRLTLIQTTLDRLLLEHQNGNKIRTETVSKDMKLLVEKQFEIHGERISKLQEIVTKVGEKCETLLENITIGKVEKQDSKGVKDEIVTPNIDTVTPVVLKQFYKNCMEAKTGGNSVSGVFTIRPDDVSEPFDVFCDMTTRGGGWTMVLNRFDGSQDFFLDWINYKRGFGKLTREFWIGLQHLHQLTRTKENSLLIELSDWDGRTVQVHYTNFAIGNESEGYSLKILKGYSGDVPDSFSYSSGMKFTTKDRDQDLHSENCAVSYNGAWWFKSCFYCQLTGKYFQPMTKTYSKGLVWVGFHDSGYSLKAAKMMIRP